MDKFKVISITAPFFFDGEAERIMEILKNQEADYVHIRKPASSLQQMEKLLADISPEYYMKIKLHDHFGLLDKYELGGIHLNSRNPFPPVHSKEISISLHGIDEICYAKGYDYFFISPVFDSISKPGYLSGFNLSELSPIIKNKPAIALGGVTPDKFPLLKSYGFSGAAMLGYYWKI